MPSVKNYGDPCRTGCGRKLRYRDGCCEPCHIRIQAEKTQKQHGIPTESATKQRWRQQAKEYNRLARQGLGQKDIATLWGMRVGQLRLLVYRIKKEGGIKVVNLGRRAIGGKLVATANVRAYNNEHGGGRTGIKNCKCDLCMQRRRISNNENKANQKAAKEKL